MARKTKTMNAAAWHKLQKAQDQLRFAYDDISSAIRAEHHTDAKSQLISLRNDLDGLLYETRRLIDGNA